MNEQTQAVPIPKSKRVRKKPHAILRIRLAFTVNDPFHRMLTILKLAEESQGRALCMTALNHYAVKWMKPTNVGSSEMGGTPLVVDMAEDVKAKAPSKVSRLKQRAAKLDFGDLGAGLN